jgi:hypothetical protein
MDKTSRPRHGPDWQNSLNVTAAIPSKPTCDLAPKTLRIISLLTVQYWNIHPNTFGMACEGCARIRLKPIPMDKKTFHLGIVPERISIAKIGWIDYLMLALENHFQ